MEILNEYIVFIVLLITGILLQFIIPLFYLKVDMEQYDNFLSKNLLIITCRLFIIEAIGGALFQLSESMFKEQILQASFLIVLGFFIAKYFTFLSFFEVEKVTDEIIEECDLKNNYKKVTPFSLLFIIWIFYTLLSSIGVYVCSFYLFGKIVPTIATTFVIFIIDLFLGIELMNRINRFLDRIEKIRRK